jgi:hypothetical protein
MIGTVGMRRLGGTPVVFTAADSEIPDERSPASYESLQEALRSLWRTSLEKQCRAAEHIELKEGAQVMLIFNIGGGSILDEVDEVDASSESVEQSSPPFSPPVDSDLNLVNGSRGVVTHFGNADMLLMPLEQKMKQIMKEAVCILAYVAF